MNTEMTNWNLTKLLLMLLAAWLLTGCAITHRYGPYMGKVVDKETNEPIEGAVVFMRFYTHSIIGDPSHFVDALEVLTNTKGEFHIDSTWIFTLMPLTYWETYPQVIVFKPGYGAFPGHRETDLDKWENNNFPRKEYVTIELPRLKTKEERRKNLYHIPYTEAPADKFQKLRAAEKFESDFVFKKEGDEK